jgi:cytochrome c
LAQVTPVNPAPPAIAGEPAPAGPTPEIALEEAFDDPVLLNRIAHARPERGEELIARCTMCHTFERDGAAGIGPNLFAIVGAGVGRTAGFNYSVSLRALRDDGATWTYNRLDAFIANPAVSILGNRMGFAGMEEDEDRAALIAYVRLLADTPVPLPGARPPEDLVAALPVADAGPAPPPGLAPVEFTRGQVEVGQQAYVNLGCAACHGPSLAGTATAPPLAGPTFVERWFGGPVSALYEFIATRKPMDNPGGLDPRRYLELLAYVIHENGLETGPRPLRGDAAQLAGLGFFRPAN